MGNSSAAPTTNRTIREQVGYMMEPLLAQTLDASKSSAEGTFFAT
jgi:hypothetical protein